MEPFKFGCIVCLQRLADGMFSDLIFAMRRESTMLHP